MAQPLDFEPGETPADGAARGGGVADGTDALAELAASASTARRRRPVVRSRRSSVLAGVMIVAVAGGGAGLAFVFKDRLTFARPQPNATRTEPIAVAPRSAVPEEPPMPAVTPGNLPPAPTNTTLAEDDDPPAIPDLKLGMVPKKDAKMLVATDGPAASSLDDDMPDFTKYRPEGKLRLLERLPQEKPASPEAQAGERVGKNPIDQFIFAKMAEHGQNPKKLCDALTFARRASLDLVGVVPNRADIERFQKWSSGVQRAAWVDFLLEQPLYADHWTIFYGDLLRERGEIRGMPDNSFKKYLHASLLENKPYDAWVREMITASGPADETPATGFILRDNAEAKILTVSVAQVFLGVQLRCAECHNHPFDWWEQRHFNEMVMFWEGTAARVVRRDSEERIRKVSTRDRAGVGTFLTGDTSEKGRGREALADLVTRKQSRYFARVAVNRLWEKLMGTGIVSPSDNFSALNPPSHPELLDWLAMEFIESGYDLKHMLRLIATSRTYQQTSSTKGDRRRRQAAEEENREDERLFVGVPVRPMRAEQVYDSILYATGRYGLPGDGPKPSIRLTYPPGPRSFLRTFGVTDRETLLPRNTSASRQRALTLLNGSFVNDAVKMHPAHAIAYWMGRQRMSAPEIVDALFLQILTRKPKKQERERALTHVRNGRGQPWTWEDVQWALFNTREFQFIR